MQIRHQQHGGLYFTFHKKRTQFGICILLKWVAKQPKFANFIQNGEKKFVFYAFRHSSHPGPEIFSQSIQNFRYNFLVIKTAIHEERSKGL